MKGEQQSARCCYKEALRIGFKTKKVNMDFEGEAQTTSSRGISHDLDPLDVDYD